MRTTMSWAAVFKPSVITMLCVIQVLIILSPSLYFPSFSYPPKTSLNVGKNHQCNWPLTWKDCDLQQTAPAKKGAGILGLFPTVPVTHWMIQRKVLLFCGGGMENGTHSYLPNRSAGCDVGSHWQAPSIAEAQGSLGTPRSSMTA